MRVAIIGCTGMFGNSVYQVLKDKCELVLTARTSAKFDALERVRGGTERHKKILFDAVNSNVQELFDEIGEVDAVINCIGVLNKFATGKTPTIREYFAINTELPINLSRKYGRKLIHISTDCVFDGKSGNYYENTEPSPSYGVYGYTKLFADEVVKENSLVLRCCAVGEELDQDAFQLLTWFKRQKQVKGYSRWFISSITGIEFGNVCWRVLNSTDIPRKGLYHLETPPISKYDILCMYKELYNLDCEILEYPWYVVDKSLRTCYPEVIEKFEIPSFEQMLKELK